MAVVGAVTDDVASLVSRGAANSSASAARWSFGNSSSIARPSPTRFTNCVRSRLPLVVSCTSRARGISGIDKPVDETVTFQPLHHRGNRRRIAGLLLRYIAHPPRFVEFGEDTSLGSG